MERNQIYDKLTVVFREVFDDNDLVINDKMTAHDVDQWTSLSHVILIAAIEKSFKMSFQMQDLDKLDNVGDIVELLIAKL
jgi:acyl carrier protein